MNDYNLEYVRDEIVELVDAVSHQLNIIQKSLPAENEVVVCGVLNGGVLFFADLVRRLNFNHTWEFVKCKSYIGEREKGDKIIITRTVDDDLKGKTLILVDDILDTGHTAAELVKYYKQTANPDSIWFVSLIEREDSPTISGVDIQISAAKNDKWLIGYGMDGDNGYHRNLKNIISKI